MLGEAEIRQALAALDASMAKRGIKGEVCLFGGAVMVLAFQARQSTRDVDAVFAPATAVREAVAEVGQERGWAGDWLNDGVKGFVSARRNVQDAGLNLPNLAVTMPVPEYLLAMKCMAARAGQGSRDMDDVKFLIRRLGLPNPGAVLTLVEDYYPPQRLTVKTRYFVEAAFEEMAAEPS